MGLFGRTKVSRPIPVPPPVGDTQFPGSTIFVRNKVIPLTGGQYAPTVTQSNPGIGGGECVLSAITVLGKK